MLPKIEDILFPYLKKMTKPQFANINSHSFDSKDLGLNKSKIAALKSIILSVL